MYNRYLDSGSFALLEPEPQSRQRPAAPQNPRPGPQRAPQPPGPDRPHNDLAGEVSRGLSQLWESVGKRFSLEKLDTGDILLVLIILFLYLEDGDNLELVITLGLLLLLGDD